MTTFRNEPTSSPKTKTAAPRTAGCRASRLLKIRQNSESSILTGVPIIRELTMDSARTVEDVTPPPPPPPPPPTPRFASYRNPETRTRKPFIIYITAASWKIGKYMAITIPPTTTPMKTMMIGLQKDWKVHQPYC